jgi:spermidine synthase
VGVDLDEQVLSLRTRYFDALLEPLRTPDAKVSFVHADAEQFLGNSSAPAHTVIVNDCYVKVHSHSAPFFYPPRQGGGGSGRKSRPQLCLSLCACRSLSDWAGMHACIQVLNDLPPELLTEQFTKRVHSRLIRGGGYYINVLSHYNGSGAEPHVAAAATVRAVFGNVEVSFLGGRLELAG